MEKPTLVILAAGMGSRYGGLKQIDPVDDKGTKIIDFSIYDAVSMSRISESASAMQSANIVL